MNDNNEKNLNNVPDNQLEDITGGNNLGPMPISASQIVPVPIISNYGTYSSGDTPKYQVGQQLGIKYRFRGEILMVRCMVLSVSQGADLGVFCEEFGYTVEILSEIAPGFKGKVVENVYESCLYV